MNPGWWRAVEALPDGAVMADWALELGNEFEAAQPLLQPTAAQAETHPCTNRFRCECRHRVEPDGRGGWVAVCDCDQGCPPLPVAPKDVLVYASNDRKLSAAIARGLGLSLAASRAQNAVASPVSARRSPRAIARSAANAHGIKQGTTCRLCRR